MAAQPYLPAPKLTAAPMNDRLGTPENYRQLAAKAKRLAEATDDATLRVQLDQVAMTFLTLAEQVARIDARRWPFAADGRQTSAR
jgi:hypothetical protein